MAAPMTSYLLYPELFTKEGLLEVLKQRYIQKAELGCLDKEELLKLYYQYVIPLPQRKYRQNRHGRCMTKKQILMNKKRKIDTVCEEEPPNKKRSSIGSQLLTSYGDTSPQCNRLKPPPSCIDFNKKVIKLSSSTKSTESDISQVTEIVSGVKKLSTSPKDLSNKHNVVSLKQTVNNINKHLNGNKNGKKNGKNKANMIKRKEVTMEVETDSKIMEGSNEPKKKIKKISWP